MNLGLLRQWESPTRNAAAPAAPGAISTVKCLREGEQRVGELGRPATSARLARPAVVLVQWVPDDRAGHAVPAAAAAAQLGTDDRNDLDAGIAQRGVGLGVAVIGEHHPRLQSDGVVRAVPLLALGRVVVPGGLHQAQPFVARGLGDHVHEAAVSLVPDLQTSGEPTGGDDVDAGAGAWAPSW